MEENIVDFEDYNIKIDLNEIENMNEGDIKKCKEKIAEITRIINKK